MIEKLLFGMASCVCPCNSLTGGRMLCVSQAGFLRMVFCIKITKSMSKKLHSNSTRVSAKSCTWGGTIPAGRGLQGHLDNV